jgi:hypothetical protein
MEALENQRKIATSVQARLRGAAEKPEPALSTGENLKGWCTAGAPGGAPHTQGRAGHLPGLCGGPPGTVGAASGGRGAAGPAPSLPMRPASRVAPPAMAPAFRKEQPATTGGRASHRAGARHGDGSLCRAQRTGFPWPWRASGGRGLGSGGKKAGMAQDWRGTGLRDACRGCCPCERPPATLRNHGGCKTIPWKL